MIVRWLRERRLWAVLALAILAVVVPTARAGAAVHAYDAPTVERADIHQLNTAIHQISSAGAGTRQIGDAQWPPGPQEDSASPSGADRGTSTSAASRRNATEAVDANVVMGRKGSDMLVESGTNVPGVVNGRAYSAHAFDQMQGRGIVPLVVDDTIATGVRAASRGATTVYYGAGNNISVVVNAEGKVVTVSYGDLRP